MIRMRARPTVVAAAMTFCLLGCTADPAKQPVETGETVHDTPIHLIIGDDIVGATVWDTPTGRDLLDRLPVTLTFADFGGQEKVARLDGGLTMEGMPSGDDPEVGDLGYYAPNGVVVLYTGEVGFWNGIARIGRMEGDLSVITEHHDDFTVTIERAG